MFIDKAHRGEQAPLGAACRHALPHRQAVPLLTELEEDLVGLDGYRHVAPNGAVPSAAAGTMQAGAWREATNGEIWLRPF